MSSLQSSVKLLSKGVLGVKELATACRSLKTAEKTFALEALAGQVETFTKESTALRSVEVISIEKAPTLSVNTFESIALEESLLESYEISKRAQAILAHYKGKYLSEKEARQVIRRAGISTSPRPNGIPENFRIQFSDKGAGMIYIHPDHTHTSIRIMPGKPHSSLPCQQKPYVIHKDNGKTLDKFGNVVSQNSPEAHIPLNEFTYIKD